MNINEIVKAGVIGGIVIIVIEAIVGAIAPSISYAFGFVVLLVGGVIAGWMIKGKQEDAIVAGILAGLIYVILGLFIIFPAISTYRSTNPIIAIVVGIVLGAIGGIIGKYLNKKK